MVHMGNKRTTWLITGTMVTQFTLLHSQTFRKLLVNLIFYLKMRN